MHIRKRLLSVLTLLVLLSGVIFGSTLEIRWQEQEEEVETPWSSLKETIYVWYTDEALSGYIGTAAVNFSEREGVRIIPVLKSSSGYLEGINEASLNPDVQMPDAYIIHNDELEKAYLAGLAVESPQIREKLEEAFPETALSAVSYRGHLAAWPFYYDTSVLVYNKDYLGMWVEQQALKELEEEEIPPEEDASEEVPVEEEPVQEEAEEEIPVERIIMADGTPITVEGILHFADTFDAPEGVDGVMKWAVSDIFYNYWMVGRYLVVGGDCGDDENNIDIYNDETIQCLKTYQALNQFFYIEPDSVNYDSAIQDFMDGKLVFTIGSTDVLKRLSDAQKDGSFHHQYGISVLPQISTKLDSRTLSVTSTVAVNGYSSHRDLANQFAEYLTTEFAGELYDRAGKMAACKENVDRDVYQQEFFAQYEESVSLPKMMEIGNLWLQLEVLFSRVWNGEDITPLVQAMEEQISTQLKLE